MPRALLPFLFAVAAAAAFSAPPPIRDALSKPARIAPKDASVPTIVIQPIATGLPDITAITHAGDRRLFVTLQRGQVMVWDGTQIRATPFLDISALVICCGEQGLLSTAFHPNYAVNGFFFVNYTDLTGQTVVARYRVSDSDPNVADPFSAAVLLTIPQPFANHNGGQLQFGPDGFLYIGMGDGGSSNDPQCNAQSSGSLLGKMLRINVDQNVLGPPYYGIPDDNPYIFTGGPAEAWAYGLRNPWRFSFDRLTGNLFIGDVGQGSREEIDYQPLTSRGGENYGWKVMEGTECGDGGTSGCVSPVPPCGDPAYTLPILEYTHENGNCAVAGGYVYRGTAIPDLQGSYIYGDYCSGQMWMATQTSGAWSSLVLPNVVPSLTTFGEDIDGELYLGTPGTLYAIVPPPALPPTIATIAPASGSTRGGERVVITGTNFTGQTGVAFGASVATVNVQSSTLLVAVSPSHPPGLVDVTVANRGVAPAVRNAAFGYVAVPRLPRSGSSPRVVERP
jgi:glucose/arabinose dehydrogenase